MANFDKSFPILIKHEGKFSWDKNDSGGPTMYGCTQHDISVFLGRSASVQDVRNFSLSSAAILFRKNYWNVMHCDLISSDTLATCVFDQGVLSGTATVIMIIQRMLGAKVDGQMGPETAGLLNKSPMLNCLKFLTAMDDHYKGIVKRKPSQKDFINGWENRLKDLKKVVDAESKATNASYQTVTFSHSITKIPKRSKKKIA